MAGYLQRRQVKELIEPQSVMEGAGVRLKRSIATRRLDYLDPFLLFDHFGSDDPADYVAGFPMHPHRGIETVTYMLAGTVRHEDSLGNVGSIRGGDIQWMTAGSGILHEEMPQETEERLDGFQLWVNLPAKQKMTAPRYRDVSAANIPMVHRKGGVTIRIIAGAVDGIKGAVSGIFADPSYLDVSMSAGTSFEQPVQRGHNAFIYVFQGEAVVGTTDGVPGVAVGSPRLVVLGDGDSVRVETESQSCRFLLVSGQPLHEPIARYGPFVMNTREEIEEALRELRNGTFVKVNATTSGSEAGDLFANGPS